MKDVKLLEIKYDNRWETNSLNEFTITVGQDNENCQTFKLPVTPGISDRLLEMFMPEVTAALSTMFESLTGSDSPDVPTEQDQEAFLMTEAFPETPDE